MTAPTSPTWRWWWRRCWSSRPSCCAGPSDRDGCSRLPGWQSTRFRSGAFSFPAWSARSTTRSTFYLALPGPTLTKDLPNLRCLNRTTPAFRPPPDYGSGAGWRGLAVRGVHPPVGRGEVVSGLHGGSLLAVDLELVHTQPLHLKLLDPEPPDDRPTDRQTPDHQGPGRRHPRPPPPRPQARQREPRRAVAGHDGALGSSGMGVGACPCRSSFD